MGAPASRRPPPSRARARAGTISTTGVAAAAAAAIMLAVVLGRAQAASSSLARARRTAFIFPSAGRGVQQQQQQQQQRRRGYRASGTALWDSRRRRNPHFETNVSSKEAGQPGQEGELGWKAWEFGEAPWAKGDETWDPATGKQLPKKKRKEFAAKRAAGMEGEGEGEEEAEDLKEENRVSDVAAATACLARFATPARLQRLREIVERRTEHVAFVFENPSNPNNMWACLRSLDAFGVQNVHLVVDPAHYRKPHRLAQAKSAMGSQKWLTLAEHPSATACVEALKAQGYRVLASDLKPGTSPAPIQEVDWVGQKVAVVMGNEERGITDEMRAACDGTYFIPMQGFAESFNLSVGTAVTLATLNSLGGLKHGDLPQADKDLLFLRWLIKSVPQGAAILRREGLLKEEVAEAAAGQVVMGYKIK